MYLKRVLENKIFLEFLFYGKGNKIKQTNINLCFLIFCNFSLEMANFAFCDAQDLSCLEFNCESRPRVTEMKYMITKMKYVI